MTIVDICGWRCSGQRTRLSCGSKKPKRSPRQNRVAVCGRSAPTGAASSTPAISRHTAKRAASSTSPPQRTLPSKMASSRAAIRPWWRWPGACSRAGRCRPSSGARRSSMIKCAVYILNRASTRSLNGITPYEAWNRRKPPVDHLPPFGCVAHMKKTGPDAIKLADRSPCSWALKRDPRPTGCTTQWETGYTSRATWCLKNVMHGRGNTT